MDDLLRSHAPITPSAWAEIDAQAKRVLEVNLAARRVVDFDGPRGWRKAAVKLGRVTAIGDAPSRAAETPDVATGPVQAALRVVQPLVELRAPFTLSRAELDGIGRGATDVEFDPLVRAATAMAHAEDHSVFHGFSAAGIAGIVERSPHAPVAIPDQYEAYPTAVAEAVRVLRVAGVDGPYAIALGPRCWTGLVQAMGRGGYPVLEIVRQVAGSVVWAPAVNGAVVLSTRGGDFSLTVGQDLSIGYTRHSDTTVDLYVVETMTFRALAPEAAVWLRYAK